MMTWQSAVSPPLCRTSMPSWARLSRRRHCLTGAPTTLAEGDAMKSGSSERIFTPSFYKKRCVWRCPSVQQALNQAKVLLDTMMVSHVGGVGAATVATQIDNLLMLVGFGVNSCILIFASGFQGCRNRRNLKACFGLQLLLNVCIAGLLSAGQAGAALMVPVLLQRRRPAHRAGEAVHLHQRLFLFLHRTHQRVYLHVPQRADHEGSHAPRSRTNCLNALLNYLLIFGKLGFRAGRRGGAAIATVIATFCGLAGHVTYAFVTRQPFLGFAGELFRWPSTFLRPIFRRMIPMAGNDRVRSGRRHAA